LHPDFRHQKPDSLPISGQIVNKFFVKILTYSSLGVLLFAYMYYSEFGNLQGWGTEYQGLLFSVLLLNVTGFTLSILNLQLSHWLPWRTHLLLRFLSGVLADTLLGLLLIFGAIALPILLLDGHEELSFLYEANRDLALKLAMLWFFGVFIFTILDFTRYSYRQYAIIQVENHQLVRKQLELQYNMLKSQLSPHYLFNCLNTISSLVYRDTAIAEEFIRHFALTYRYILNTHQQRLVKVAEEVDFVRSYIYLMRVRFDEGLQVSINLSEVVLNTKIPPLTLQLLVENAVKHNMISEELPLHISILADKEGQLTVMNNKTIEPEEHTSFSIGLSNIRKRYSFFTHHPVKVTNNAMFTVELPLLQGLG